jgi:tRNA U34 5-methylaminomethyl-2-thiouridine-forming methyltransferase MnmC
MKKNPKAKRQDELLVTMAKSIELLMVTQAWCMRGVAAGPKIDELLQQLQFQNTQLTYQRERFETAKANEDR